MNNFYDEFKININKIINQYSSKTAVVYMKNDGSEETFTFQEIGSFFALTQKKFKQFNLKQGDRAAIISKQSPWTVFMGIALMYFGITIVPIDASLPIEEIEKLLQFSDVRALFTSEKFYRELNHNITYKIPCFSLDCGLTVKNFNSGIALPATPDPEYDVATVIFSSGTTGQMKGIKVTYVSVIKSRDIVKNLSGLKSGMKYLLVLPFNHIAGFTSALTIFLSGCCMGFIEDVDSSKLQQGFLKFEPHCFVMIPKVYEVMEQKIRSAIREKGIAVYAAINILLWISKFFRKYLGINIGKKMFASITKQVLGSNAYGLGTGASPCKPETAEFFLNLGIYWANFYASTETNIPVAATGVMDKYSPDTVGNVHRYQEIKIKILNPDKNGIGEIIVKSELMMKGYFRRPDLTQKAFKNDFFRTGDYGFIDKKGYLHVTGRMKESIVLQNGKKVSPSDVDEYYLSRISGYDIASRGIVHQGEQYDEIHLFIADQNYSDIKKREINSQLNSISRKAPSMYKISGIHFIPQIPRTSVGKVKRFQLEIPDKKEETRTKSIDMPSAGKFQTVCGYIKNLQKLPDDFKIKGSMRLKEDIGMDSINVFELCVQLDEKYNTSIESRLHDNITVSEIVSLLNKKISGSNNAEDLSIYPLKKSREDKIKFNQFTKFSRKIWNFSINGLENVSPNENYIFCPNHESHFDGMWIIGCLDKKIRNHICTIAADYLFEKNIYRYGVIFLGGIPVHRTGNSAPAMKRAFECITNQKYNLLIHPEGTRTRNGKLGKFKNGAARLSIDSNVKIIPVCIGGAREIFPPNRPVPHLFDWKNLRKYPIKISFGTPVAPENKTPEQITAEIRSQIIRMKSEVKK